MPKLPKIHKRERVDPGDMYNIERLELEFSNGEQRVYQRLLTSGLGAVIVVPMLDENTVLLVREYAAGIHAYELGLPKGRLEKGESTVAGANRELKEECGYGAHDLRELTAITLAPGYMTHRTHLVLARDLYPESLPGDEPEPLECVPWPIADLATLVNRDDCTEGRTIAALYIAREYLRKTG
jgi:ADP-ribose diphosphatase